MSRDRDKIEFNPYGDNRSKDERGKFSVPEGYFESLTDRVLESVAAEEVPIVSIERVTVWQQLKPVVGLAASFLIFAMFAYFPLQMVLSKSDSKELAQSEIIESELNDLMAESTYTLSSMELVGMMDEISIEEESDNVIDDSDIEDYILLELSDFDLIN